MKKYCIMALWFAQSLIGATSSPRPNFSESIPLLGERDMIKRLKITDAIQQVSGVSPELAAAITNAIRAQLTSIELSKAAGRAVPDIGHDTHRIHMGVGNIVAQPIAMVLTFSGKKTLEETVRSLQDNGVAHNFIIDTNGNIHPVTKNGESVDEALSHRLFSVGISGFVHHGFDIRDMNAHALSISIVGRDDQEATREATESLVTLVRYLSQRFSIPATRVLDYGCVALHATPQQNGNENLTLYGRRKVQAMLPWTTLASHGLAILPRAQDSVPDLVIDSSKFDPEALTSWTSLALRKIGFLCPPTHNKDHQDFKGALQAFQEHTKCDNQSGIITHDTIQKLNSMIIQHQEIDPRSSELDPKPLT